MHGLCQDWNGLVRRERRPGFAPRYGGGFFLFYQVQTVGRDPASDPALRRPGAGDEGLYGSVAFYRRTVTTTFW